MKFFKRIVILSALLLSFTTIGCYRFNDANIVSGNIVDDVIEALDNGNAEELKKLFSDEAISNTSDIDKNIEYLMQLYQGKFVSKEGSVSEERNISGNNNQRIIRGHYTVKTDVDTYMFFIVEKIEKNSESNGLYFLQIIPESKKYVQLNLQGDEKYGPGIFTPDMMNADDYMTSIMWALDGNKTTAFKSFFSKEVSDKTDIDSQIDKIFEFYEGKKISYSELSASKETINEITYIKGSYQVDTDVNSYIISFIYVRNNINLSSDGLYSLSIMQKNEETNEMSCSDTPGILIFEGNY